MSLSIELARKRSNGWTIYHGERMAIGTDKLSNADRESTSVVG